MVVSVPGRRLVATLTASVFLLAPLSALAVTAGPNTAGSGAEAAGAGTIAWSNEGNITADDTSYATAVLSPTDTSEYLVASNFGFAIPSNATIDGITVTIARQSSANTLGFSINDAEVRLVKNGVIGGDNNASGSDWPTSMGTATYGGSTDDWGEVWTPADINNSAFGVALSAVSQSFLTNRTASVDYIRVSVDYSLGATVTPATGGSAIPNNTAGGAYTTLTGPVLAEAVTDNIGNGTIILNAPSGFQFDASSNVTVLVTRTGGSGGDGFNINGLPSGGTINATETASAITISITDDTDGSVTNSLTWQGIKVRPTAVMPLASGNITNGGTSIIDAVSAGSNFGYLESISSITSTTTSLTSDNNPSTYGDSVTFTATVTGSSPTGTVEFYSGATLLGSDTLDGSFQATYTTSALNAGSYSITAEYLGDISNSASTSSVLSQVVNQKALTITASNLVKTYGTTYTFAGTEFGTSAMVGGDSVTSVTLTSGGAVDTATVAGSPYSITASNAVGMGLSNYAITYDPGTFTVNQAHLEITADNDSKAYGTTNTYAGTEFTASGLLLTDMVTSVTLASTGDVDSATVAGSTYPIVASAAVGTGLDNYTIDYYDGALTVTQATSVTDTVLRTPTPNSTVGTSVVLNAEVTGGLNPTGTVSFYSGAVLIGSGSLANGSGTYVHVFTQAGSYDLTAQYGGDSNHQASTSATISVHIVDKDDADTVTTISSSGSSLVGAAVDFTATVAGAYNPTGTVEFYSDAVLIGTGSLNGSFEATLNHTFTQAGNYEITAHYLGDSNNNPSQSIITVEIVLDQEVRKDTPATSTVLSVANPSTIGDMVNMSATVSGGYNPTGVVFFKDGGSFIGSGALVAGTATFSTDQLAVGSHNLTAEYQGDVNNNVSTSAVVTVQVVQQMTSVTILGNIPTPLVAPASITFDVTVNGYFPTGSVTIMDGPAFVTTVNLSNGSGSFTQVFTGEQFVHSFTAEYPGDVNNTASVSPAVDVLVTAPSQQVNNAQQGAGSDRGQNTNRANSIAQFLANVHLGNLAPGAFGGADAPLAGAEKEYICSIQRSLPSLYTSGYLNALAEIISRYTGRTADVIAGWLRDPSVCADITEARLGVERVAQVELTPFYVSSEGFPLSKNATWNKCVTGKFTYEDIQANPDRDREGTPKSCADYHTGSSWYHPDHRMFFDWNVATKKLTLPAGYVIKKDEAVSVR